MSALALDLYQRLRESGMGEDSARKAAEALDSRFAEAKRESERHAERAAQDAAEKVRAGTVAAEEYHRRMENTPTRAENETEYAKLREDNKALREEMHAGFAEHREETRADNKALREEMHAGFARIDRFFVGIVLLLLGLYFGSFLWF